MVEIIGVSVAILALVVTLIQVTYKFYVNRKKKNEDLELDIWNWIYLNFDQYNSLTFDFLNAKNDGATTEEIKEYIDNNYKLSTKNLYKKLKKMEEKRMISCTNDNAEKRIEKLKWLT